MTSYHIIEPVIDPYLEPDTDGVTMDASLADPI